MKIKIIDKDTFEIIKEEDPKKLAKKKNVSDNIRRLSAVPNKQRENWWDV